MNDQSSTCLARSHAGTGKGTTVAEIVSRVPNGVAWSNGNVFRCLTLLALTWQRQREHAEKKRADWLSKQQLAAPLSSSSTSSASSSSKSPSSKSSSSSNKKGGTKKKPPHGRSKHPAPNASEQRARTNAHRGRKGDAAATTTMLEAAALTHENIDMFMGMLEFGRFPSKSAQQLETDAAVASAPSSSSSSSSSVPPATSKTAAPDPSGTAGGTGETGGACGGGRFDVRIKGLGLDDLCSDIEHTALKSAAVAANVPAVARASQGHVVKFAAAAVAAMAAADNGNGKGGHGGGAKGHFGGKGGHGGGKCVVLEGRQATVDYVQSQHRFELTANAANAAAAPSLSPNGGGGGNDDSSSFSGGGGGGSGGGVLLLGKRRAAQCIAAAATKQLAKARQQGSGQQGGGDDGAMTSESAVKAALLHLSTTAG